MSSIEISCSERSPSRRSNAARIARSRSSPLTFGVRRLRVAGAGIGQDVTACRHSRHSVDTLDAMLKHEHVDVLVIGAGISGIGAAFHLQDKCPGRSYAV